MTTNVPDPPPTSAQLAVRWHVVVFAALLFGSVPVVHVVWHGLLGHAEPVIASRSQVDAPAVTLDNLLDGSWMPKRERELREASPIVWWLRTHWNELLFRAGLPRSRQVHVGRDGWFFLAATVAPDRAMFDRRAPARRRFFADVRDRVRAAGAELLVYVVPDKARVYPEFAFDGGGLPPAKAAVYGDVVAELGALGIDTVDMAAAMTAARAAAPTEEFYYRHDTHWRPQGALAAARALTAAVEAGPVAASLSPRRVVEINGKDTIRVVGDLTGMLGLGTVEIRVGEARHTTPMTLLTDRLAELRDYYGVALHEDGRALGLYGDDESADVWIAGTSFADENGWRALTLMLGRPLNAVTEPGAGGTKPIRDVLGRLADPEGPRPKLVIWEIVERGLFEDDWRDPRL